MKRRTQDERSAETRRLLHQATIALLLEVGYANTTTQGIARRAGVSRGAQTHHYPEKLDLIFAATADLFNGFADDIESLAEQLRTGQCDMETLFDRVWHQMLNGTWFYASLEIIVAARGDAELRRRLAPLILDLHARFEATWETTFVARNPEAVTSRVAMNLVMNVFRGMAVQAVLRTDERYYAEMLAALKEIAAAHIEPVRMARGEQIEHSAETAR